MSARWTWAMENGRGGREKAGICRQGTKNQERGNWPGEAGAVGRSLILRGGRRFDYALFLLHEFGRNPADPLRPAEGTPWRRESVAALPELAVHVAAVPGIRRLRWGGEGGPGEIAALCGRLRPHPLAAITLTFLPSGLWCRNHSTSAAGGGGPCGRRPPPWPSPGGGGGPWG